MEYHEKIQYCCILLKKENVKINLFTKASAM